MNLNTAVVWIPAPDVGREAFTVKRNRWVLLWIPLGIVLISTAMSVYYARSIPSEYTGKSIVLFNPGTTKNGSVVGNETVASSAAGYTASLGSAATIGAVSEAIEVPPKTLEDGLTLTVLPATTTVSIAFTSTDPEQAAGGANAMAAAAVEATAKDPLVEADVLAPAAVPTTPSGPFRSLIVVSGTLLGIILATLAVVIIGLVRRGSLRGLLNRIDPEAVPPEVPEPSLVDVATDQPATPGPSPTSPT